MTRKTDVSTSTVNVQPVRQPVARVRRPPQPVEKVAGVQQKLKAERIQEKLRAMPSWKLTDRERAIGFIQELPNGPGAAMWMARVSALAGLCGQPVDIRYARGKVKVTVYTLFRSGRRGVTQEALDFARLIA